MPTYIESIDAQTFVLKIAEIVDVYREVWQHVDPPEVIATYSDGMLRHAGREGFACRIARNDEGQLVGFGYGYTGKAGQPWRDYVTGAMPPDLAAHWLSDAFVFMELAVLPAERGQGIGGQLHDYLLRDLPQRTAVLSTPAQETPALKLYRTRGWVMLVPDFCFPNETEHMHILGQELNQRGS